MRSGCPTFEPQPATIPKPATILLASPNFRARDNTTSAVDSVVIHTTEGSLAGTLDIFLDPLGRSVSAHFVIAPSGDIYEMVDTSERASHATYYNSRSIGIEMVGYASRPSTWNGDNLASLVDLLSWLLQAYPEIPLIHPAGDAYDFQNNLLDTAGLVEHSQVQPWNKTDPGRFFPWGDVLDETTARLATVPESATGSMLLMGMMAIFSRPRFRRLVISNRCIDA